MNLIAEFNHKKSHIEVYRDPQGEWYVKANEIFTQKRLNASEIVRYLANAANDE